MEFFKAYCKTLGIPFTKASKIIDGRYKPYLSALDDQYYQGNNIWDAKTNALQTAVKKFGKEDTYVRLIALSMDTALKIK